MFIKNQTVYSDGSNHLIVQDTYTINADEDVQLLKWALEGQMYYHNIKALLQNVMQNNIDELTQSVFTENRYCPDQFITDEQLKLDIEDTVKQVGNMMRQLYIYKKNRKIDNIEVSRNLKNKIKMQVSFGAGSQQNQDISVYKRPDVIVAINREGDWTGY